MGRVIMNLFLRANGIISGVRRLCVTGVAGALLPAGVTPAAMAAADDVPAAPTGTTANSGPVVARDDAFSAVAQARLQGSKVEDLSQRTDSVQVFANPDGYCVPKVSPVARWDRLRIAGVPLSLGFYRGEVFPIVKTNSSGLKIVHFKVGLV